MITGLLGFEGGMEILGGVVVLLLVGLALATLVFAVIGGVSVYENYRKSRWEEHYGAKMSIILPKNWAQNKVN